MAEFAHQPPDADAAHQQPDEQAAHPLGLYAAQRASVSAEADRQIAARGSKGPRGEAYTAARDSVMNSQVDHRRDE